MDSLITAAAGALASGDPLGALNRVALRDDAPALALRGLAMAQLGDLERARALLQRAARAFGARETMARARCIVAEAEIALVSRDLAWPSRALDGARDILRRHGDHANAAHAHYLQVRRLLLLGRLDEAEHALAGLAVARLPPASQAALALVMAGIAMRRVRASDARQALAQATHAALGAGIPALQAEVARALEILEAPVARLHADGQENVLTLGQVEALFASDSLIVDACRYRVRRQRAQIALESRPVLFVLAQVLAEAWPADVSRNTLIARAFGARHPDESHRARLRVEIGRLRRLLAPLARIDASARGFALHALHAPRVVVLKPPVQTRHAGVLALLADGESWSSSALALALGGSQRTVQRALEILAEAGEVQCVGRGRAQRWLLPALPGFPTTLLLPTAVPGD